MFLAEFLPKTSDSDPIVGAGMADRVAAQLTSCTQTFFWRLSGTRTTGRIRLDGPSFQKI